MSELNDPPQTEAQYPKPDITKEEYDTPDFWDNYLEHVHAILPNQQARQMLAEILYRYYECGDYEETLVRLLAFVNAFPASIEVAWPYIRFCRNVVAIKQEPGDVTRARAYARWKRRRKKVPSWLFERLFKPYPPFMRCKYCGRYIPYMDPDFGYAYLGMNHCEYCGRSYPAPSFQWDSVGGQAYIFYRRSVTEPEFYRNSITMFNVINFNNEKFGGDMPYGLGDDEDE
jgi:hypothetical protein